MGLFVVKDKPSKIFKDIIYIKNGNNRFEYKNTSLSPKEIVQVLIVSHPEFANDVYDAYNTWLKKGNASDNDILYFKVNSTYDESLSVYGASKITPENAYTTFYNKYKEICEENLNIPNKASVVYSLQFKQPFSGIKYYVASEYASALQSKKRATEKLKKIQNKENPSQSEIENAQEKLQEAELRVSICKEQYRAMIDVKKWLKELVDKEALDDQKKEDEQKEQQEEQSQEDINKEYKEQQENDEAVDGGTLNEVVITPKSSEDTSSSSKSDSDAKNDGEDEFIEPINALDPVVVDNLDPDVKSSFIAKGYVDTIEQGNSEGSNIQMTSIEGVYTPIIKYNNIVLDWNDVSYMKLNYTGFTPELELHVYNWERGISFSETPGINNEIDIILLFPVDEIYKKIALKFYIKEYKLENSLIKVKCDYKNMPINKKITTQIGTGDITLYECLKTIAKDYKIGFAATKKCEDVQDKHPRLVRNQSIRQFIKQQILSSGVDKDSVFDCFIDVYNYINLINLSYVMKEEVDIKSLGIYSLTGVNGTTGDEETKQKSQYVYRIITNAQGLNTVNNLMIDSYENLSNTDELKENGTLVNYFYVHPFGVGDGCNSIEQNEIQIKEDSIDGAHTDEYEFKSAKFMGFEMSDTPILYQSAINKSYRLKHNAHQLKVRLRHPNLGLMRGQLVGVYLETSDMYERQTIIHNASNALNASANVNDLNINADGDANTIDYLKNTENAPITDLSRTDIYYINGIEWEYQEYDEVVEYLYLVKKGRTSNYSNRHTIQNINSDGIDTSEASMQESANEAHETENKITSLDNINKDNNPDGEGGSSGNSTVSTNEDGGSGNESSQSNSTTQVEDKSIPQDNTQSSNDDKLDNESNNTNDPNIDSGVNNENSDRVTYDSYNHSGISNVDQAIGVETRKTEKELSSMDESTKEMIKADIYNLKNSISKEQKTLDRYQQEMVDLKQWYGNDTDDNERYNEEYNEIYVYIEISSNKIKQYQQKISDLETKLNN